MRLNLKLIIPIVAFLILLTCLLLYFSGTFENYNPKNSFLGEMFGGCMVLLFVWLFHLIPLLIIAIPVWILGRYRVNWTKWDYSIVFAPFAIWAVLILAKGTGKSLSNLIEGFIIGCIAPVAPIIRVIIKNKMNEKKLAITLLMFICIIAIALWHFMPALPE